MTEHHDHRDDCPFKFATLDVCDCVEKNMLDRIEALTKERDAAYSSGYSDAEREISNTALGQSNTFLHSQLAKAKHRIEALTAELATCEKYRDAYAECDRIGTQAVRDLEAKLAQAVERLEAWVKLSEHCSIEDGVCCCGEDMEGHSNPMNCGHSPVDHGAYIAGQLEESTRATLATIKGESHE